MTKTIFCDIDGVLVFQEDCCDYAKTDKEFSILPGTLETLREWESAGMRLILITGRRESSRAMTERMLEKLGISYDKLIMGISIGPRIVINDYKEGDPNNEKAQSVNVKRNTGIRTIADKIIQKP